jgi:K+-transporting ATPase ATPase C chain
MRGQLLRDLRTAAVATVLLTVVFGLGYPALMTGFAQVAFKHQADGSLITVNAKVVGSALAAQAFTSPKYFLERPSATSPAYNAAGTTFSNLGPTDPALTKEVQQQVAAILKLEGPYNPGLTVPTSPSTR